MVGDLSRTIDINKVFVILLSRWYFIVLSVTICLVITNLMLRYSKPVYMATMTLKLEDEKPNQLSDFFKFGRPTGKLENFLKTESEIMKSRTLGASTLRNLDYNITYTVKGSIISSELYPNNAFSITYLHMDSSIIYRNYIIRFKGNEIFEIGIDDDNKLKELHNLNDTFFFDRSFIVVKALDKNQIKSYKGVSINYRVNDPLYLARYFSNNVIIDIEKGTSILNMSFSYTNPQFAADYLNTLTKVYIEESVNNKSQAAQQTITFINDQLLDLSDKVKSSQNDMTSFKTQNKGVELEDIGKKELEKLTRLETDRNIVQLKLKMLSQLEKKC